MANETNHSQVAIKVAGVEKVYRTKSRDIHALASCTFEVRKTEFLSLVGPSGCGKTTLLNILGGLLPPSRGEIWVEGRKLTEVPDNIGYVFQDPVLLPWRTVIRNVRLPLDVRGVNGKQAEEKARQALDMVGLWDFRNQYPHELSGGMKQRVAIARALGYEPSILMMDEPFGALDALTREKLNLRLLKIWSKTQKTVVFVTHNISEAVFLSDRVAVFQGHPGTIKTIVEIDLPRPRGASVMDDPRFAQYISVIRKDLGHLEEEEEI
ncbi:MAG: ABC transporter ATP-binding protein [Thermodesulfobacteriota bacterium]